MVLEIIVFSDGSIGGYTDAHKVFDAASWAELIRLCRNDVIFATLDQFSWTVARNA